MKSVGSKVLSMACSPDGRFFAAGSHDGAVCIFNAHRCEAVDEPLSGHSHPVLSVAFSPDSQSLASGSVDGSICAWDVEHGDVVKTFEGHSGGATSVTFSSDGQRFASGSWNCTIKIRGVETSAAVGNLFKGHTEGVKSAPSPLTASEPSLGRTTGQCASEIQVRETKSTTRWGAILAGSLLLCVLKMGSTLPLLHGIARCTRCTSGTRKPAHRFGHH